MYTHSSTRFSSALPKFEHNTHIRKRDARFFLKVHCIRHKRHLQTHSNISCSPKIRSTLALRVWTRTDDVFYASYKHQLLIALIGIPISIGLPSLKISLRHPNEDHASCQKMLSSHFHFHAIHLLCNLPIFENLPPHPRANLCVFSYCPQ